MRLPTAFPWPRLDWAALIDREKQMISHIPGALGRLMADRGVKVIRGQASFIGPNEIRAGDRNIDARHIVIATGSKPRSLPIAVAEHMITSDDVLSEREQPREVVLAAASSRSSSGTSMRVPPESPFSSFLPRMTDAVAQIRTESERIDRETCGEHASRSPQRSRPDSISIAISPVSLRPPRCRTRSASIRLSTLRRRSLELAAAFPDCDL